LVTPLFLLLVFGIIELGPMFLDWSAARNASTQGAREASAAGSDQKADFYVATAIRASGGTTVGELIGAVVWKAATPDDDPPADCMTALLTGGPGITDPGRSIWCNVYSAADLKRPLSDFGRDPIAFPTAIDRFWEAQTRVDFLSGPPDLIGVTVVVKHQSLLGVLPDWTIKETTVNPVEARRSSP
jgi:hypothetical protein